MEKKDKIKSFRMLVLITTPKLASKAADMFQRGALPIQYRFTAQGTASSELMDVLGLGSIKKCMLVSIMPTKFADVMLDKLCAELQLNTVNSGIAFTIPLTAANNLIVKMLARAMGEYDAQGEGKDENVMAEMNYVLIAAFVNRGYSNEVMNAARKAGAGGGTVMHSRRIGNEEVTGFWGMSVQEEKEVVLILSENENKAAIMREIGQHCGMHSDAKGIVMSLPIDSVIGFQSGK